MASKVTVEGKQRIHWESTARGGWRKVRTEPIGEGSSEAEEPVTAEVEEDAENVGGKSAAEIMRSNQAKPKAASATPSATPKPAAKPSLFAAAAAARARTAKDEQK